MNPALSGKKPAPIDERKTAPPSPPVESGFSRITGDAPEARLEYRMYLFSTGTVTVDAYLAPTQKFQPGTGLRYAISFDDQTPQIVNLHADDSLAAWEREVADGVKTLSSKHAIAQPGYHVLTFRPLDPGMVLQKLVVRTTAPRRSYLGPPESASRRPR